MYEFWNTKITSQINSDLQASKSKTLINLASNEYFKSIHVENLNAQIISPVFKDYSKGRYKVISFFAKKARGLMSAYIIKNKLKDSKEIKAFNLDGYRFNQSESSQTNWIFQRNQS